MFSIFIRLNKLLANLWFQCCLYSYYFWNNINLYSFTIISIIEWCTTLSRELTSQSRKRCGKFKKINFPSTKKSQSLKKFAREKFPMCLSPSIVDLDLDSLGCFCKTFILRCHLVYVDFSDWDLHRFDTSYRDVSIFYHSDTC